MRTIHQLRHLLDEAMEVNKNVYISYDQNKFWLGEKELSEVEMRIIMGTYVVILCECEPSYMLFFLRHKVS